MTRSVDSVLRIPATWMRGGTSKGLFFDARDLPLDPGQRDGLLLRALGSPDPYGKQIDGVGGASSSTSKVVLIAPSVRTDCDVDYLFGQVAIDRPLIDWSGNCGNLTAAVGPFALHRGMLDYPADGVANVRIWQVNTARQIVARVPVKGGAVDEVGDFRLDGVAFAAAPIELDFIEPGGDELGLLPTGRPRDELDVPGAGRVCATLINAGNPMVLVDAGALGVDVATAATRLNEDGALLARCEAVRTVGSLAMGLVPDLVAARARQHTPKLALLARPVDFVAADGRPFLASEHDIAVRVLSMGVFHHAIPGTAAIAIAAAVELPGTVASDLAVGRARTVRIAHPSGCTEVSVAVASGAGGLKIARAGMTRSARVLMDGVVRVPTAR